MVSYKHQINQDLNDLNGMYLMFILTIGMATLAYGMAAIFLIRHKEVVNTSKGAIVIYFWYKENYDSLF